MLEQGLSEPRSRIRRSVKIKINLDVPDFCDLDQREKLPLSEDRDRRIGGLRGYDVGV